MRAHILSALLLPALVMCRLIPASGYVQDTQGTGAMAGPSPAPTPTSGLPLETLIADQDSVEARQVPAIAPVENAPVLQPTAATTTLSVTTSVPAILLPVNPPGVAPVDPNIAVPVPPAPIAAPAPIIVPPVNPVPPPVPAPLPNEIPPAPAPAPPATSTTVAGSLATGPFSNVPFVTVQWGETFIGGTYSTWVPYTISLDFKPERTAAPIPGKGNIGMGTLTGETGQTQTVAVVEGAAPTPVARWAKGVAAVVGVGIAGVI
ncbi:uncharacterized protein SETTUDRAFT_179109 [Exserohilum turcica Et28A]|uniref:Uncharacterized protein n=1 Tax=Exserohilum turcicum (strain 28A) TaxID=671987 RepID=R0KGZ3_EXST2|nr:uncharacterized protein SETTUDRAFT_179109 [Exserohilum turcica Et28A]EOA87332.1 hypothetical protein SETTUDRAFT_179109 [Exserohilum turcica Et28A]